jgi:hypothetical protein
VTFQNRPENVHVKAGICQWSSPRVKPPIPVSDPFLYVLRYERIVEPGGTGGSVSQSMGKWETVLDISVLSADGMQTQTVPG